MIYNVLILLPTYHYDSIKDSDLLREIRDKLFPKDIYRINSDSLDIHLTINRNLRYNDYPLEYWTLQENKVKNSTVKELIIVRWISID